MDCIIQDLKDFRCAMIDIFKNTRPGQERKRRKRKEEQKGRKGKQGKR